MFWVRSNRRFGSWVALFAIAIQLVLSFGHIHLEDIHGSSPAIAAPSQTNPSAPVDDDHGSGGHDFCAICASLNLTSSSVLPAIVSLVVPIDHPHTWVADVRPTQISYNIYFLFQARAPPHSI
jgi:hypothetical protein